VSRFEESLDCRSSTPRGAYKGGCGRQLPLVLRFVFRLVGLSLVGVEKVTDGGICYEVKKGRRDCCFNAIAIALQ